MNDHQGINPLPYPHELMDIKGTFCHCEELKQECHCPIITYRQAFEKFIHLIKIFYGASEDLKS